MDSEYISDYCLGLTCRWYEGKADATCFKVGVLPHCSPSLKAKRKLLDANSPDMYEALKGIEVVYAEYMALNPELTNGWQQVQNRIRKARQALNKVEGRE